MNVRPRAAAVPAGFACQTLPVFPDLVALHATYPARYPHLLESVAHGSAQARYDILFAFPGATLAATADGRLTRDGRTAGEDPFLPALEADWRALAQPATDEAAPPFTGGWFLFLSYELGVEIEPTLARPRAVPGLPLALATRFPAAIIRDHASRQTLLVCETERAAELLPWLRADALAPVLALAAPPVMPRLAAIDEDEPAQFLAGVARVLDYIRAGDVYQVNLSRGWRARLAEMLPPVALYRALRHANPAPFAALMTLPGGRALVSSSPERLVQARQGVVRTRPIAGTHPRAADAAEDARLAGALRAHPKERAEHIMLIDLERNDLGRVCRPGSVQVPELMTLESYRHVHHLVSEVRGILRPTATPVDVLRAVFPGGTITGCPKLRCMQIISELEAAPRGAYTGSLGYLNRDGSLDLNILIRTLVQDGEQVTLRAGAGIVADSDPQRELAETRAKARGLLAALEGSA